MVLAIRLRTRCLARSSSVIAAEAEVLFRYLFFNEDLAPFAFFDFLGFFALFLNVNEFKLTLAYIPPFQVFLDTLDNEYQGPYKDVKTILSLPICHITILIRWSPIQPSKVI